MGVVIDVGVLGPLIVRVDDADVAIAGRRERCVLAVLGTNVGQVVSTTVLVDHVWGDEPPRTAGKSLQTAVTNLRRAVRDVDADGEFETWLETVGAGYRLNLEAAHVDLKRFELQVARGRRHLSEGAPGPACEQLTEALDLWRGDHPADLGDGIAATIEAHRLSELRLEVLADRLDADLQVGRHQEVLPELGALCETWTSRERLHELLMLALYRAGRQSDALAVYGRLRSNLIEQGGLDPGESVQTMEQRILTRDPGLLAPIRATPAPNPSVRRSEVPRPVTLEVRPLIGREGDLAPVIDCVARHDLVTLVGPGGVGKTTLARHAASLVEVGDVTWCSLGSVSAAESVVPALATALGVQQRVGVTMRDAIVDLLSSSPALLVLDNCEHLLDVVAELAQDLLRRCPGLTVLATSRERLGVVGEHVWPVDGLASGGGDAEEPSAAVQLFLERAAESDPHFSVAVGDLAIIEAICRDLDGLPLAIELAAARVRALPIREIAKRLRDRFELLGGGHRGEEAHHRSLRATVAWSYNLLAERERRLFRRLATFSGPFTIEAAEAVAAHDDLDSTEIPALLADLVDKSMVAVDRGVAHWRYRLLETLRAFAREMLAEAGEREAVDGASMNYYRREVLAAGIAIRGPDEPDAVDRIEGAFDNVRQAFALAAERRDLETLIDLVAGLAPYLHFRIRWEATAWVEDTLAMLDASSEPPIEGRRIVAGTAGWCRWFAGDLDRADEVVEQELARGIDSGAVSRVALVAARSVVMMYQEHPRAIDTAVEGLALAETVPDDWLAAYLCGQIAIAHAYAGRPEEAAPYLTRQAGLARRLGNASADAWSLYCQAEVSGDRDPQETISLARRAAVAAALAKSNLLENVSRITAVTVAARHGHAAESLDEFALLIERFRRDGAWTHLMVVVWNLIEVLESLGAIEAAATLLHAAPPGAPAPYGDQLARLDAVRARLEEALGPDALERSRRGGEVLTRRATADTALGAIAHLTSG